MISSPIHRRGLSDEFGFYQVIQENLRIYHYRGYNMTALQTEGGKVGAFRYHPDPERWRTQLNLIEGMKVLPLEVPEYQNQSIEDPRLFLWKGSLHCSFVIAKYDPPPKGKTPCVIGYGRITGHKIDRVMIPQYGKNDWTGVEKNWVFFEDEGHLHFIYSVGPQQRVVRLDADGRSVKAEWVTMTAPFGGGTPRGGTNPMPRGKFWLRFFHAHRLPENGRKIDTYSLGALLMDAHPPYQVYQVSRPLLTGDDNPRVEGKYFKSRVCMPFGVMAKGQGWDVALGWNDSRCGVMYVHEGLLKRSGIL